MALLVGVCLSAIACGGQPRPADTPPGSIAATLGIDELSLVSLQGLELSAKIVYEEQLARCMKVEGFEYISEFPNAPALLDRAGTSTEAEFVERFGWGIVHSMAEQARFLVGDSARAKNQQIYSEFTPSERSAYDAALAGTAELAGCVDTALESAREQVPGAAIVDAYRDEIDQTIERFMTDLRVIAFNRTWSRCMAEFDFAYGSPDALSAEIAARANAVRAPVAAILDALALDTTLADSLSEDTLAKAAVHPGAIDIIEVRNFELDAAAASLECGVGPSVYGSPAVYRSVLDGLERRFLSEHPGFLNSPS